MPELEDAPWATGGDELPDAPWAPAEKGPLTWSQVPGQALKNLPESAGKFVHPFLHPVETVKGMAGLSGGLAEKAAKYASGSGMLQGVAGVSKYLGDNKNEQMADEFGQQMKDRYGGIENVKHTLAEDPVGAAADLSTVLTGGGSLAARAPGIAGRIGEVAGRVGSAIDPLRPVTKGIEKVGELLEPAKKVWDREQGVRLSQGQDTGDLGMIQREQAALRNLSGKPAQERAEQFFNVQQKKELDKLNDKIRESLDPHGNMVEDPVQAGAVVGQGMRDTYEMRRKVVSDHFYDAAKRLGGDIDASWFDNIADRIKTDLSSGSRPVVINKRLTPFADQALKDIETQIQTLRQPSNRAMPGGQPPRSQIVGVSLEGVDQLRRRLASWRDQAFKSGNAADGAATQAVLRAFEGDMDVAVNSQHFSGDPRAPQAWNEARKAHSEVRETFGAGKRGDSAGQEVERMLGRRGSAPLTAADTFQSMVPANLRSSTKHVETVNRVKKALGEDSPEFAAVRQGTFSRLTETPAGVKDWGPGKVADRINKFLNGDGRELAEAIFTPEQRARLQKYGELQRKLEIPQAGANWSNTATFRQRALDRAVSWVPAALGAAAGHMLFPGAFGVGEIVGAGLGKAYGATLGKRRAEKRNLKEVAPQLPISKRRVKGGLERVSDAVRPGLSRVLQGQPTPAWRGRSQGQPTPEPIGRRVERVFGRFGPSQAKARGFGALGRYTQPYGDQNNPYAAGGRVDPFFDDGGDVPSWYDSGTTDVGAPAAFPDAPPLRQDRAFNTSIDRWKQLGKDAFFAPADALKSFNEKPTFNNALGIMPMGTFAGPLAKTANLTKLRSAEELSARGYPADHVLRNTGWFQGADSKWRFEIPDDAARFRPAKDIHSTGHLSRTVGEGLDHRALFEAYPDLARIGMRYDAPQGAGFFQPAPRRIGVGLTNSPQNDQRILLHELQHAIQEQEGFARGANPREFSNAEVAAERARMLAKPEPRDWTSVPNSAPDSDYGVRSSLYRRHAGEVEARAVEKRMNLTPLQRLTRSPWDSWDVPQHEQIVR